MLLSTLDLGFIRPPQLHAYETISHLFELAPVLEESGYHRLWLAEHYSYEFAWMSPETLIPLLLGSTEKLKVGAAGMLMGYHSALRVAHSFKMAELLFPGRVDLGFANGIVHPNIVDALIKSEKSYDFDEQVRDTIRFMHDAFDKDHPYGLLSMPPHGTSIPSIWALSTSDRRADLAVEAKGGFCLSLFHDEIPYQKKGDIIKNFKDKYFAAHGEVPQNAVAVQCICLDDHAQAQEFYRQRLKEKEVRTNEIIGDREHCYQKINELRDTFDTDEIVIYDASADLNIKTESLTMLGEMFGQSQAVLTV